MRNLILILYVTIVNSGISLPQPFDASEIYEKYNKSVVKVYSYDFFNELRGQASGTVAIDTGIVITNLHVFEGGRKLTIEHDGYEYDSIKILGYSYTSDILIMKVFGLKLPPLKTASKDKIKIGQKIFAIGSPLGYENSITDGIIAGLRVDKWRKNWIQITAGITYGSSGGAVINELGELVGISTKGVNRTNINLNFAIAIYEADELTSRCEPGDVSCIETKTSFFYARNLIDFLTQNAHRIKDEDMEKFEHEAFQNLLTYFNTTTDSTSFVSLILRYLAVFDIEDDKREKLLNLDNFRWQGLSDFMDALILTKSKRYLESYQAYTAAINAAPKNSFYYYHYGLTLWKRGDRDGARKFIKMAAELNHQEAIEWIANNKVMGID